MDVPDDLFGSYAGIVKRFRDFWELARAVPFGPSKKTSTTAPSANATSSNTAALPAGISPVAAINSDSEDNIWGRFGKASWNLVEFGGFLLILLLKTVVTGSIAALIALSSTIVWVTIVFSSAGTMILSGLYEATLDRKVIEFIQAYAKDPLTIKPDGKEKSNTDIIPLKHIHLLYAVLVGNLRISSDLFLNPHSSDNSHTSTGPHPSNGPGSSNETNPPSGSQLAPGSHPYQRNPWKDVEALVEEVRVENPGARFKATENTNARSKAMENTKTRFKAMLDCQAAFGAAIGGPVVFFLGSFLFNTFSTLTTAGDNDTSHALGFGQWWMTVVHVAVLSGCLLAGNNPSTLEVAVCGSSASDPSHRRYNSKPAYDAVWMWERGRSKRNWIRAVQRRWGGSEPKAKDPKVEEVKFFDLSSRHWVFTYLVFALLLAVPFVLAFLTAYFTPLLGVSCRSLTFLIYFCSQLWLCLGWAIDFPNPEPLPWVTHGGFVPTLYGLYMGFGLLMAIFTTLAGTFMQLIGVYRNCLCDIPVGSWTTRDAFTGIPISTNSADEIYYAKKTWLPTGVASIVVLIVVVYVGWWYQRHWRARFTQLISLLPGEAAAEAPVGSEVLEVKSDAGGIQQGSGAM